MASLEAAIDALPSQLTLEVPRLPTFATLHDTQIESPGMDLICFLLLRKSLVATSRLRLIDQLPARLRLGLPQHIPQSQLVSSSARAAAHHTALCTSYIYYVRRLKQYLGRRGAEFPVLTPRTVHESQAYNLRDPFAPLAKV